ncbi:MAG: UDP-2,4-diacetamido-2,4,6-trideoxy-beta-L-altropyranose hydrolase [Planctomycetes bacterium]|nr:UDP-2,4-diacetamido-2,4,6-trideoxy-beta-L-altropyranose hydrolase [Planctomycetota bacterium]
MPYEVLFRCDGSPSVGLGHVLRCRSLAEAMARRGARVRFVIGAGSELALALLSPFFPVHRLAGSEDLTRSGLGDGDLAATLEIARKNGAGMVVVDHYGATAAYLESLAQAGVELGVIDDLADRDLSAAGWVLNQNLGADDLPYRVRQDCRRLFGPSYALLRPGFASARGALAREFRETDSRVLVALGGGDATRSLAAVLDGLERVERRLAITCLATAAVRREEVDRRAAASRHRVELAIDVEDVTELMARTDLSVNGGGSVCWELACLGVPMIVLVRAANQVNIAGALERAGCARNLGPWNDAESPSLLAGWVDELLSDSRARAEMSRRAATLVDGRGADRAAEEILMRRTQR